MIDEAFARAIEADSVVRISKLFSTLDSYVDEFDRVESVPDKVGGCAKASGVPGRRDDASLDGREPPVEAVAYLLEV